MHAQSQEGVDSETVNVTDLRNADPSSFEPAEPEPASPPYMAGLSEEEIREALLFEQGNHPSTVLTALPYAEILSIDDSYAVGFKPLGDSL